MEMKEIMDVEVKILRFEDVSRDDKIWCIVELTVMLWGSFQEMFFITEFKRVCSMFVL